MDWRDFLIPSIMIIFFIMFADAYNYKVEDPMSLPPIIEEFYSDVIGHPRLSDEEIIEKYFYIHESVDDLGDVDLETSFLFSFMYRRSGKDVIVWREPTSFARSEEPSIHLTNCDITEYTVEYYIDYQHNTYVEDHVEKPIDLKFLKINGEYYTHVIYKSDGKIQVYPNTITILTEVY